MLKRILRHPRTLALGAALLACHLRLVGATTRWTVEGKEGAAALAGRPVIGAFWHEQLALAHAIAWNWSGSRTDTGFTVLVSQHRDGRLIGDVVSRLGIGAAHGSSRRGGVAVFREAQRVLTEGRSVAITPDGPRGPRRIAQSGVARLARLAAVPVIPVGVAVSRARRLGSWDRMIFPLPFCRGAIVYGTPLGPGDAPTEEALREAIAAAMTEVAERAANLAGMRR
ncbi:lysophospholipid acyltransferase family protein [Elioraea sp.]|uniref:lysophospholipid acyltransferase family protein n=1 Tax=Elioraea sp. TaxID=2185103 RepID=UPI0025C22367|nr:lysophospholipid acyltransferase family protein [Elioraea sp.]